MKNDLHKKVDEVLNSLDDVQRAEASPFLYSKIRNRMEAPREFLPQQLVWRLAAALIIVAVLNLFTIVHFQSKEPRNDRGVELVANEYSISLPQTY